MSVLGIKEEERMEGKQTKKGGTNEMTHLYINTLLSGPDVVINLKKKQKH